MADHIIDRGLLRIESSFRSSLTSLLSLSVEEIRELEQAIRGAGGFPADLSETDSFLIAVGSANQELMDKSAAASYLYGRMYGLSRERSDLLSELASQSELLDIQDFEEKREAFGSLFSPDEVFEANMLRVSIRRAAPTLRDVTTFCDLRATNRPGRKQLLYVPAIIMRLVLDEPIAGQEALVVQLTERGLDMIDEELKRARDLLERAREDLSEKIPPQEEKSG